MISRQALTHLGLDEVWWLVSPQNPLKPTAGMAALQRRMDSAAEAARGIAVRVTDIEVALGTTFTADTLRGLRRTFPGTKFVWLMGADNMVQISRWARWTEVFDLVPVAVFGRPDYSLRAMSSRAARRFARHRVPTARASALADMRPPAWTFIHYRHDPVSATAIRARGGNIDDTGHRGSGTD